VVGLMISCDSDLYLRLLTLEDVTLRYVGWLNDSEVTSHLETKKITLRKLKAYIWEKLGKDDCLFFGIFADGGKHIGNIKLEPIDLFHKEAALGILIGDKDYWNKGIATKVLRSFLSWVFTNMEIDSILLGVYKKNSSAVRLYSNVGFQTIKETSDVYTMQYKREFL